MDNRQKNVKEPISKEKIFKVMMWVTFLVTGLFFLKNVFSGDVRAMAVIGACLVVFAGTLFGMRAMKATAEFQHGMLSVMLLVLVFVISLFSGDYYSDDFPLYLAVLGLAGLYLRPKYTLIQIIVTDVLLVLQYVIHPEKADSLSQFIMCEVIFTIAALMFYLVIKRGRAYIERSELRAEEAEQLIVSMNQIGENLEQSVGASVDKIQGLQEANNRLTGNAGELKEGSEEIARGAREVVAVCDDVQARIQVTERQVGALNEEVKTFEDALKDNRKSMVEMHQQMASVQTIMQQATEVFRILEEQMREIIEVTDQMNSIASSTNMLALNASIEAARAGQSGAGFAVVASKVQDLAVDSNRCSSQVAGVVDQMKEQIFRTTEQLTESEQALSASQEVLDGLQDNFDKLTQQFASLYENIEEQNGNVNQVESIFGELKEKILKMNKYSEDNQSAVGAITDALGVYKDSVSQVIEDANHVHEVSATMITVSKQ